MDFDSFLQELDSAEVAMPSAHTTNDLPSTKITTTPENNNLGDIKSDSLKKETQKEVEPLLEEVNISESTELGDTLPNNYQSQSLPIEDETSATITLAKSLYDKLGFQEPFDEEWFKEEYGKGESKELDLDSFSNFYKSIIDHNIETNSKPVFANEYVERYNDYVSQGGDPKQIAILLQDVFDYSSISKEEIETDSSTQEAVIWDYLHEMFPGKKNDFYKEKIDSFKQQGLLLDASKEALPFLIERSQEKIKANVEAAKEEKIKEQQRIEAYWKEQEQRINSKNEIANTKLDKTTKQKLIKYMSSGDFNKVLQDPEKIIELAFIALNGGAKFFDKKANTVAASTLAKNLKRYTDSKTNIKTPHVNIEGGGINNDKDAVLDDVLAMLK